MSTRARTIKLSLAIAGLGVVGFFALSASVELAVKYGLTNASGAVDTRVACHETERPCEASAAWKQSEEWIVLRDAIKKDAALINKIAAQTGVPARMIVAPLVSEQLRLYNDQREIFKEFFSKFRVLGDQSQYSWGVMGIKPVTAERVENNLHATTSSFYLGIDFEHMLNFSSSTLNEEEKGQERLYRLINERDHTYAYLYGALYIKQVIAQWKAAGFDISKRPEIITTLYNIGFENSRPKVNPQAGGSTIKINGVSYSFGGLGYEFYYSDELLTEFPR
jgi:hypothetical protein